VGHRQTWRDRDLLKTQDKWDSVYERMRDLQNLLSRVEVSFTRPFVILECEYREDRRDDESWRIDGLPKNSLRLC